jgi:Domain of unknown function (DUF4350)
LNPETKNVARATAAAVILALLLFTLLVAYAPDSVALSPNNYGWNGLQGVSSRYNLNYTTSLAALPSRGVLVVMQPSVDFGAGDVQYVRSFLDSGGTLLVADKSGYANSLLTGLKVGITIDSNHSVEDTIYNWKAKTVPTALVLPGAVSHFPQVANVTGIALNQPSPLLLQKGATEIAETSQLSFDVNASRAGGGLLATASPPKVASGPFAVAAAAKVGNGTVFVVGDSQFLFNSEWTIADNEVLIGNLFSKATVLIDASHWLAGPLSSSTAQVKGELRQLYGGATAFPMPYILALLSVGAAVALTPTPAPKRKRAAPPAELTSFNREVLERIRKDRESLARNDE